MPSAAGANTCNLVGCVQQPNSAYLQAVAEANYEAGYNFPEGSCCVISTPECICTEQCSMPANTNYSKPRIPRAANSSDSAHGLVQSYEHKRQDAGQAPMGRMRMSRIRGRYFSSELAISSTTARATAPRTQVKYKPAPRAQVCTSCTQPSLWDQAKQTKQAKQAGLHADEASLQVPSCSEFEPPVVRATDTRRRNLTAWRTRARLASRPSAGAGGSGACAEKTVELRHRHLRQKRSRRRVLLARALRCPPFPRGRPCTTPLRFFCLFAPVGALISNAQLHLILHSDR